MIPGQIKGIQQSVFLCYKEVIQTGYLSFDTFADVSRNFYTISRIKKKDDEITRQQRLNVDNNVQ
ncbi:hypothetical protein V2J09_015314 [Rumex salicifolius]